MDRDHLRVAITTNSLIQCDANFISAKQMVIYDIGASWSDFVDVVHFSRSGKKGPGGGQGAKPGGGCWMDDIEDVEPGNDPLADRIEAAAGCSVLFTCGLSDLAAMRLHAQSVFPVKSERVRPIDDVIANVQRMMQGEPPLWMRRLIRDKDGNTMRHTLSEQVD
jgi:nitrogen fixation protein NifX